jgi:hypothetical protein
MIVRMTARSMTQPARVIAQGTGKESHVLVSMIFIVHIYVIKW